MTRSNDICKSYTIHAADGRTLSLSETADRLTIEVTVSRPNDTLLADKRSVRLTLAQFRQLCDFNSSYDGLRVEEAPEPEEGSSTWEEPEEEVGINVIPA